MSSADDNTKRPNYAALFDEMVIKPVLKEAERTGLHPYEIMAGVTPAQKALQKKLFPSGPKYTKKRKR